MRHRSLRLPAAIAATLLLGLLGGCADATDPVQPPPEPALKPTSIEALTNTIISGTVATAVDPSPTVRVLDQFGKPMRGVEVRFHVMPDNGTVTIPSPKTDENGVASAGVWTLGTHAGRQTLQVSVSHSTVLVFTATAVAGPPAIMTHAGGSDQRGVAGVALLDPLRVRITDAFNNGVAGVPTVFAVVSGAGTIAGGTSVTGAGGMATSGAWTPGESGLQQVSAKSGVLEVIFTAYPAPADCSPAASCAVTGRLAFSRGVGIYAGNVDGSSVVQVADSAADAVWSPDGSRIAFSKHSRADRARHIYVANADGSNVVRRTTGTGHWSEPAWSPDGQNILYVAGESGIGRQFFSVRADGAGGPVLVYTPPYQDLTYAPAWSPDGTRIAFVSGGRLNVMNSDGTGVSRLASAPNGSFADTPTWAPDGRRIAVTEETSCEGDWDYWCDESIRVVDVTNGSSTLLVYGSRLTQVASHPAWSPDGATIAFTGRSCGTSSCSVSIEFIKVDGSARGLLMANASGAAWKP